MIMVYCSELRFPWPGCRAPYVGIGEIVAQSAVRNCLCPDIIRGDFIYTLFRRGLSFLRRTCTSTEVKVCWEETAGVDYCCSWWSSSNHSLWSTTRCDAQRNKPEW